VSRRLEDLLSHGVPLYDTLREEKWWGISTIREMSRGRLNSDPYNGDKSREISRAHSPLVWKALGDYADYMDQLVSLAKRPYRSRPADPPIPGKSYNPLTYVSGTVNNMLLPTFSRCSWEQTENETQNLLLLVHVALEEHHTDHKHYPPSLDQLVPAYLNRVPDDPFARSGPLSYKSSGSKYVLYSIGPDGRDDKGNPIFVAARREYGYRVDSDSKGDIVAGVNTR
jgi:hypothetical protein